MSHTELPEVAKFFLLIGVPALLVVLGIWLPFTFLVRPLMPAVRLGGGMRIRFLPLEKLYFRPSWSWGFRTKYVFDFIDAYARQMPDVYALIGVKVSDKEIREHAKKVKCVFRLGYLKSAVRERLGLDDLNNDGKADRLVGLTYGENAIEVGVVEERGMILEGKMVMERTAFTYELHNAFISKFAGSDVALGESFVPENDARLLPFLGGKTIAEMKTKRAVLDAAFSKIRMG